MAVYTLKFTVTADGITPAEVQPAGVFGDHLAAALEFAVPSQPTGCRYRLEITDGSGAYDITELLDAKNGVVSYAIPRNWTAAGTATVRLIAVTVDKNGEETLCFHAAPARLFFEERDDSTPMEDMLPAWQEVMTRAETVTDTVYEAYASGDLHGHSGVYVGSGEMPDCCNVQIDPTGDVFTLQNRKFLFLGDSYAVGSGLAEGEKTWVQHTASFLRLSFGVNAFQHAVAGASFGIAPTDEHNFTTVLQGAVAGLSAAQCAEMTDIVLLSGCNDWQYDKAAIAAGIEAFANVAKTEFPNAKVWLFYAGWATAHGVRQGLQKAYYAYDSTAPKFGMVCFNKLYQILHNKNRLLADGVHPNADGQQRLGYSVANAVLGSTDVLDSAIYHHVRFKDVTVGKAYHNGSNINLHIQTGSVTLDAPVSIVGGNFTKLFDVSCDILFGGAQNNVVSQFTNTVTLNAAAGDQNELKTAILLCRLVKNADNTLGLYARTTEVENGAFITHPTVSSISFYDNTIILPIWDA